MSAGTTCRKRITFAVSLPISPGILSTSAHQRPLLPASSSAGARLACCSQKQSGRSSRALLPASLAPDCEITLEANPGTAEAARFQGYRTAGVNRLSLGIQSFSSRALSALGRIHDGEDGLRAVALAKAAGFPRINLDLMHGLPGQTVAEGQRDIELALDAGISHLSYYQLTIEPNTAFYRRPPTLPAESILERLEDRGQRLLEAGGFKPYEISAWARDGHYCLHNLTYWRFGDYHGLGPGAHGKLSRRDGEGRLRVTRLQRSRVPEHWLRGDGTPSAQIEVEGETLREECLLNVLRLRGGHQL